MVSNIFYFHPYLGKIPILTNIFQMGWNHQLVSFFVWGVLKLHSLVPDIAPENRDSQKEFHLPTINFQGAMFSSREGIGGKSSKAPSTVCFFVFRNALKKNVSPPSTMHLILLSCGDTARLRIWLTQSVLDEPVRGTQVTSNEKQRDPALGLRVYILAHLRWSPCSLSPFELIVGFYMSCNPLKV